MALVPLARPEPAARRIVLLGAPGAGKGTHGEILARLWNAPHIATGDMLRRILEDEPESDLAVQVRVIERGQLIPDALMNSILFRELDKPNAAHGWILDGFPRTVPQAQSLDAFLTERGLVLDAALALDVTEETVLDRLSGRLTCLNCGSTFHIRNEPPKQEGICDICGHGLIVREDDKPEHVRVRLRVYEERTEPLMRYYTATGRLVRVDGNGNEAVTSGRIQAACETLGTSESNALGVANS